MKQLFFILSFSFFFSNCKENVASPELAIGKVAPDITLNDASGAAKKLSDLKGKVVILQFWASWCGPCRKENPNIVALYNKYKSQGLDIYSVSLDKDKAAWEKGIKDDGLAWANHVSDLKKWDSAPVATYGVNATPTFFLLDKQGIVRVINFNTSLTDQIEKYLK
jgi:thiol-disulfide isomerase/thioredoxin